MMALQDHLISHEKKESNNVPFFHQNFKSIFTLSPAHSCKYKQKITKDWKTCMFER